MLPLSKDFYQATAAAIIYTELEKSNNLLTLRLVSKHLKDKVDHSQAMGDLINRKFAPITTLGIHSFEEAFKYIINKKITSINLLDIKITENDFNNLKTRAQSIQKLRIQSELLISLDFEEFRGLKWLDISGCTNLQSRKIDKCLKLRLLKEVGCMKLKTPPL